MAKLICPECEQGTDIYHMYVEWARCQHCRVQFKTFVKVDERYGRLTNMSKDVFDMFSNMFGGDIFGFGR